MNRNGLHHREKNAAAVFELDSEAVQATKRRGAGIIRPAIQDRRRSMTWTKPCAREDGP